MFFYPPRFNLCSEIPMGVAKTFCEVVKVSQIMIAEIFACILTLLIDFTLN